MKKIGLSIVLGILAFILFGCGSLSTPRHLEENDGILSWSIVSKATSYIISIDDEEYTSETNSYNLRGLIEIKTYLVKVKSINDNKESKWSSVYRYEVKEKLLRPTNFITELENNKIVWEGTPACKTYTVYINDKQITTSLNYVLIDEWLVKDNTVYKLTVKANTTDNFDESDMSDEFEFSKNIIYPYDFYVFGDESYLIRYRAVEVVVAIPKTFHTRELTRILDNAFLNVTSLLNITIPNTVKTIGDSAFEGCTGIRFLTLSDDLISIGSKAFYGCRNLERITISAQVNFIGENALAGCSRLNSINVDENSIYFASVDGVFFNKDITSLIMFPARRLADNYVIPNTVIVIKEYAFSSCIEIKNIIISENVEEIGINAFEYCSNLESITVDEENNYYSSVNGVLYNKDKTNLINYPINKEDEEFEVLDSVINILDKAFENNKNLKSIIINGNVKNIGNHAFRSSVSLNSVVVEHGVNYIGDYVFFGCSQISNLILPSSIKYIGTYLLNGCSSLTSLTLPFIGASIDATGHEAKLGYLFGNGTYPGSTSTNQNGIFYHITNSLKTVVITNAINISDYAFMNCRELTSIILFSGFEEVGVEAFLGCQKLASIVLPSGVKTIKENAFKGCSNLSSVYLSDGIKIIESGVFESCLSLSSITIPNSVVSMGSGVFSACNTLANITLPFIGASITATSHEAKFGYIFGTSPSIGGVVTNQNGVTYYLPGSLRNITITLQTIIPEDAFRNCSRIDSIIFKKDIISIGTNAFNGCAGLDSFIISSSVEYIGLFAFESCANLEQLIVEDGNLYYVCVDNVLYDITKTTLITYLSSNTNKEYTILASVKYISERAFWGNRNIETLIINSNVENIDIGAFGNCINLENIVLPFIGASIIATDNEAKFGYIFGTTSYTGGVATNQNGVSYYIPNSLRNVQIISVENLVDDAFRNCNRLVSVILPDDLIIIGDNVFFGCTNLKTIIIPKLVEHIGVDVFYSCSTLTSIEVDANNSFYSSLEGVLYNKDFSELILYPSGKEDEEFIILYSVINIIENAFIANYYLVKIIILAKVEEIAENNFIEYTNLKDIEVNESNLNYTGKEGVLYNKDLTTLIMYPIGREPKAFLVPSSVINIKTQAFKGNEYLEVIYIYSSVEYIGSEAFKSCVNLTIYCEVSEQPSTWDENWNVDNLEVIWGSELEIILNIIHN